MRKQAPLRAIYARYLANDTARGEIRAVTVVEHNEDKTRLQPRFQSG